MSTKNFQKIIFDVEKHGKVFRDFALIAGTEAVKLFQENFTKQGWQGETFEPWKRKKLANGYNTLMSGNSNSLQKSIHIAHQSERLVVVATADNKPYARIHNEGGTIQIPARKQVAHFNKKGQFSKNNKRAKYAQKFDVRAYEITMPKRQFMGETPELQKRIETVFYNRLNKIKTS